MQRQIRNFRIIRKFLNIEINLKILNFSKIRIFKNYEIWKFKKMEDSNFQFSNILNF